MVVLIPELGVVEVVDGRVLEDSSDGEPPKRAEKKSEPPKMPFT